MAPVPAGNARGYPATARAGTPGCVGGARTSPRGDSRHPPRTRTVRLESSLLRSPWSLPRENRARAPADRGAAVPRGHSRALPIDPEWISLERTRDAAHGDFASNVALRLAKAAKRNPRELAQAIVAALPKNDLIQSAEVAGAGFINFRLAKDLYLRELVRVHEQGDAWGRATLPAPHRGCARG